MATANKVGVTTFTTPSDREVVVTRVVDMPPRGGDWPETLNTLVLSEKDGKTTITQTVLYPSKEARDAALQTGMKAGISESFERLAEYLRTIA